MKDTKFIIAYGLSADHLAVYAVFHTAREWPQLWLQAALTKRMMTGSLRLPFPPLPEPQAALEA
jgi:hypothetical protein